MPSEAIHTNQLTRIFGDHVALDALSITVDVGEVVALLGPNGAGKTTTVRLLNGVLAATHGSARVLGHDVAVEPDAVRRRTGVLTEHAGLDDRLTATENLLATARIRGFDDADARRRIGELLERFGMSDRADVRVAGASTGQRKRIALARSLIHDPEVLFLDEPTSGLDPAAIRSVVELISSLANERGRTVVLCTHFLGEADQLADRMAVLHEGRLLTMGRPADLAADLWVGVQATLTLARPPEPGQLDQIRQIAGVLDADAEGTDVSLSLAESTVLGAVVSEAVAMDATVLAAVPHVATVEDIYFEIERRRLVGSHAGVPAPPPPRSPRAGMSSEVAS